MIISFFFCVKQMTAYEMRISDWSSDVCSSDRNRLVWVDVLAGILAKEFLDLFLHLGHAGHAADQGHVVDFRYLVAGVRDCRTAQIGRASCGGRVCHAV